VEYVLAHALKTQAQSAEDEEWRQRLTCPICMEASDQMVAPRITKCGHIYCWPCLNQLFTLYQSDHDWKKCPLCNASIYKKDIRKVTITH
jgi:hypothetical protein